MFISHEPAIHGYLIWDIATTGFQQTFDTFGLTDAQVKEQEEYAARLIKSQELMGEVAGVVADSVADSFANMANSWIDSLGLADDGFQGFVKSLGKSIIQLIARLLAQALATAITNAITASSAYGLGAAYAAPALIAGSTAMVSSAFSSVPAFADGGIAYGPTLGVFGEYSGASSNPEVIAPLNKLRDLLPNSSGVTDVNVRGEFTVDGRSLKLVLDRTNKQLGRVT